MEFLGLRENLMIDAGAVRQMRTRIRVLAQPKSMRPIIDATQRERQVDFVWSCLVSRSGVHLGLYTINPTQRMRMQRDHGSLMPLPPNVR